MTIPEALQIALQNHQAGRLAEAEALYRQILAVQPNHADALHFLGVIANQAGRHDLAVEWIRQAIVLKPNNPAAHSNLGEAFRTMGRLDEATVAYRRALQLKPDFAEAHNNLGAALAGLGRLEEAVAAYRRAVAVKPDYPEAYKNLGVALAGQGQFNEAVAAYRETLELKADYPETHYHLGDALWGRGQVEEAVAAYRQAIELKPDHAEAHNNLGAALAGQRRLDEAMAACLRARQLKPDLPEAHDNLGNALRERGRLDDAVAAYRQALQLKPHFPEAHNNLGNALRERGQVDEAIAAYRRALQLKPRFPEAHTNLGNALRERGQIDQAVAAHREAIEIKPSYAEAHNNLGLALWDGSRFDEAIGAYRDALELQPDFPEAHNNLGNALKSLGELDEGIAAYRRALRIRPDYVGAHSNLIYALHFQPGHTARTISEEHERWNRQFSDPQKQFVRPHGIPTVAGRRLRIGYVSPDFRDHPAGRYLLPLLERHDREGFEILCYSGVARPDWMTERLRGLTDVWRETIGVSDARLAEMIREDGVDILVDLALHTADNRLPVFARQAAPVQVSWLGYPGGTGLRSIGYRLTDAHMDPSGEDAAWSADESVRLPSCWCCYVPVDECPEINALPAWSAEGVTFGSLNNFAKMNEGVLALWARLLDAIKGSRLLMFCPEGRTREKVRAFFGERGIGTERVELAGYVSRWEYLRLYHRIDLGLDPFPCNGMTTTCDALWMGVPVLTLPGEMPVSRAGLSLLSSVGLGELAASSEEDYVRIAVELATDLPRLEELRGTLRPRMRASPLMDASRFSRNVEAAYRKMWQTWCSGKPSIGEDP